MRRFYFALFLAALAVLGSVLSPGAARADRQVILTVTGEIDKANRSQMNPFQDALFGVLGETFDRGFTMTLADLEKLPFETMTVQYPNWPAPVKVEGPRLAAVLDRAGAVGAGVMVQAVDGYSPSFKMEDVRNGAFVLAVRANGKPLSLGGRGPVWLVYPTKSYAGHQPDDDSGLAWAVFHIKVMAEAP
jgi:hypothetical protein